MPSPPKFYDQLPQIETKTLNESSKLLESKESGNLVSRVNVLRWAFTAALIALFIAFTMLLTMIPKNDSLYFDLTILEDGSRIHFSSASPNSASHGLYLRVGQTFSKTTTGVDLGATDALVLTDSYPWVHGSTFEVQTQGECFKLKSASGLWLRLDANIYSDLIILKADAIYPDEATLFAAVSYLDPDFTSENSSPLDEPQNGNKNNMKHSPSFAPSQSPTINGNKQSKNEKTVKIKVCKRDYWLNVDYTHSHAHATTSPQLFTMVAKIGSTSSPVSWFRSSATASNSIANKSINDTTLFRVETVKQIKGVNLGGWFIPEVWMSPEFYAGTGLGWGGSLCALVNYSRPLAESRIKNNLDTWITENDFQEIATQGFNSVRLPIGYWNVMDDPYKLFAPSDYRTSLHYIDWAFDMASKYGLTVLLDLHGLPGSQNGIDHSGCGYSIELPQWILPQNVEMSLQAIESMVARYSNHPSLIGFELMNEPSNYYSSCNHTSLLSYYEKAYEIIRNYSPTTLVVFNELYPEFYSTWNKELLEPAYYNVLMDLHLYEWPHAKDNVSQHIKAVEGWGEEIVDFSVHHAIVVGEWSMSTGYHQARQPFIDACVNSFDNSWGWYLWTWKVQRGIGFDEWDVQYQFNDIENGMDPMAGSGSKANKKTVTSEAAITNLKDQKKEEAAHKFEEFGLINNHKGGGKFETALANDEEKEEIRTATNLRVSK